MNIGLWRKDKTQSLVFVPPESKKIRKSVQKNINRRNLPQFGKIHKSTHSRNSANVELDNTKEICTQAHNKLLKLKKKKIILKLAREN